MSTLYERDFYAWTHQQAELLRQGRLGELDTEHLIEELNDLGSSQERALEHRLGVLLGHLLKWQYQPDYPGRKSWRATINEQRRAIDKLLRKNPSLKTLLAEAIPDGYAQGVNIVVAETPLDYDALPAICPYREDEILGDWWPGADHPSRGGPATAGRP
jgi:hypothetical protein